MEKKYFNVLSKLYSVNRFKGVKLSLENIKKGCVLFGDVHKSINAIHITGTNGKGSVSLKIAKILENSGYKTGLFTSPHLFTFRERIQINSKFIEKQAIIDYFNYIFDKTSKHNINLTYFEYLTLLALIHFQEEKVDFAVMEGGLGGKLDAVNVLEAPILSIVTSIGLDHCETLGYTLEEISKDKCQIIKQNGSAVIGPNCEPKRVFEDRILEMNAKSDFLPKKFQETYDEENQRIAKHSIHILQKMLNLTKITNERINFGLQKLPFCRMEKVDENKMKNFQIVKQIKFLRKQKQSSLMLGITQML